MNQLNLILRFKLAGDSRLYVNGTAGIKFDGRGGLEFYDAVSGSLERIDLRTLEALRIQPVKTKRSSAPSRLSNLIPIRRTAPLSLMPKS